MPQATVPAKLVFTAVFATMLVAVFATAAMSMPMVVVIAVTVFSPYWQIKKD